MAGKHHGKESPSRRLMHVGSGETCRMNASPSAEILSINPVERIRKLVGEAFQGWVDRQVAPDITGRSSRCYMITGRRQMLIAQGLAEDHWFATGLEKRGNRGHAIRSKRLEAYGRTVETQTFKDSDRVIVEVSRTLAETAVFDQQREAWAEADEIRRESARRTRETAEATAKEARQTPEEWLSLPLGVVDAMMTAVLDMLEGRGHKWISELDTQRVKALANELRATVARVQVRTRERARLRLVK